MPKHKNTFSKILPIAQVNCPHLIMEMVSKLKVENVLNPPQKPTNTNKRAVSERGERKRNVNAIIIHASTFANKVANGIPSCSDFKIHCENRNRIADPNPPPKNTHKKLLRFMFYLEYLMGKYFKEKRAIVQPKNPPVIQPIKTSLGKCAPK